MFNSRYALTLGGGRIDTSVTAVLFGVHFDLLAEVLGPQVAIEVLKAVGGYVNEYFDPLGGFSARHRRGEILTILPRIGLEEGEQLVHDFARELQQKDLAEIQVHTRDKIGIEACFEIFVTAGITEGNPAEKIEQIMAKAEAKQKIIARYQCVKEGV
jgi:GGDEF domain-containing protein